MFTITIDDREVMTLIRKLQSKTANLAPVMAVTAEIMETAVRKNFEQGGRPAPWRRSKRALQEGGQTLIKSGSLLASITSRHDASSASVGTNKEYARIHHFGGKTRPHVIRPRNKTALFFPGAKHPVKQVNHPGSDIPARPFLVIPEEDMREIRDTIASFLTEV